MMINYGFIVLGAVLFTATFLAQQGAHSRIHHTLAGMGLAYSSLIVGAGSIGNWEEAITCLILYLIVVVAVVATDDLRGISPAKYVYDWARRFWR